MQTIKDFVEEAAHYEYSSEYFEMCKECANLVMMEMYIESQEFMLNNMDVIKSGNLEFTEGFLFESVEDTNALKAIYEEAEKKKKNIFKRILEKIKEWIAKFGNFMMGIVGKKKLLSEEELRELEGRLTNAQIDNNLLMSKINELEDKYGIAMLGLHETGLKNSTLTNELNAANAENESLKKDNASLKDDLGKARSENEGLIKDNTHLKKVSGQRLGTIAKLQATLREAKCKILNAHHDAERMKYAVNPETLVNAFTNDFFIGNGKNKFDVGALKRTITVLDKAVEDQHKNGITVKFAPAYWNKLCEKVKSMDNQFQDVAMDEIDADADTVAEINKYNAQIAKIISSTITFINAVVMENGARCATIKAYTGNK